MLIQPATAPGAPFSAQAPDDSRAGHQITAPGTCQRQNQVPELEPGSVTEIGDGETALILQLQHGQISARIPPSERGPKRLARFHGYPNIILAANRMIRCNHYSLSSLDAAGIHSMPRVDGNYRSASLLPKRIRRTSFPLMMLTPF